MRGDEMRIEITSPKDGIIKFEIIQIDERKKGASAFLSRERSCIFQLPNGINIGNIHPDLLGLSALLMSFPFITSELELNIPISTYLAKQVSLHTPYTIGPINDSLKQRIPSPNSVPGLSFSAGVDSTAALALMPKSTVIVFLDRSLDGINVKPKKSLYRNDAALRACRLLSEQGRTVYQIKSGMEFLRQPIGFPTDLAVGIPVVLLAEHENIDSVAYGTIMESAYRVGHKNFQDYQKRVHFTRWHSIFHACGLSLNMVVAGISEVGTQIISSNCEHQEICRSCIRGTATTSCLNCWKCFRKKIVEMAVEENFDENTIENLFKIKEAITYMQKDPIQHQNVLAWACSKYLGDNKLLLMLKKRTRGDSLSLDWLKKWYPPSLELIPMKYRTEMINAVSKFLEPMNDSEIKMMQEWNLEPNLSSEQHATIRDAMITALNNAQ